MWMHTGERDVRDGRGMGCASRLVNPVLALMLCAGVMGCSDEQDPVGQGGTVRVDYWARWAQDYRADRAADAWSAVRLKIGQEFAGMLVQYRALPFRLLGAKYLGEERYEESFRMYCKADEELGEDTFLATPYVAALAGERTWLERKIAGKDGTLKEGWLPYLEVCLAWAQEDYERISDIWPAVQEVGTAAEESDEKRKLRLWIGLMYLKALVREGKEEQIWVDGPEIMDDSLLYRDVVLGPHFMLLFSRVGEEQGRIQDAAALSRILRTLLEKHGDRSWEGYAWEADARIERCEKLLNASEEEPSKAQMSTTRPGT